MADYLNDLCPERIIHETGFGFCFGAICGSVFHFPKGFYNSRRGSRFIGGAHAVRMNLPRVGGYIAAWSPLVSTLDCAFVYARQKEDPWNLILAGAAGGGLLKVRQGFGPAGRAVLGWAAFVSLLEGVGIMFTKFKAPKVLPQKQAPVAPQMGDQTQQGASPSWFGGLFGTKSYVKDEILEGFDSPMPTTFDFDFE